MVSQEQFAKDMITAAEQFKWLNEVLNSDERPVWRAEAVARRKIFRQAMERIAEEYRQSTEVSNVKFTPTTFIVE